MKGAQKSAITDVGYNTKALESGNNAAGLGFVKVSAKVGEEGGNLLAITPVGVPAKSAGQLNIQTLDKYGKMVKRYGFYQGQTRGNFTTDGWYDTTDSVTKGTLITPENDVTFQAGQGLWIAAPDGVSFQNSGAVLFDDVTCNLNAGNTLLCNPFPTEVMLTKITPIGVPDKSAGQLNIQTLNKYGKMVKRYGFYQGQTRGNFTTDGWYDTTESVTKGTLITTENDIAFPAGQGLWVAAPSEDCSLKFSWNESK